MLTFLATAMMSCITATVYYKPLQTRVRHNLEPSELGVRCGITRRQSTGSMHCWSACVSLFQKTVCSALHADKPTNLRKLSAKGGVHLNECGHILHIMCQAKSEASGATGLTCPICAVQEHRTAGGDGNRQHLLKWLCCMSFF